MLHTIGVLSAAHKSTTQVGPNRLDTSGERHHLHFILKGIWIAGWGHVADAWLCCREQLHGQLGGHRHFSARCLEPRTDVCGQVGHAQVLWQRAQCRILALQQLGKSCGWQRLWLINPSCIACDTSHQANPNSH